MAQDVTSLYSYAHKNEISDISHDILVPDNGHFMQLQTP